jgi:hypothetical protein
MKVFFLIQSDNATDCNDIGHLISYVWSYAFLKVHNVESNNKMILQNC